MKKILTLCSRCQDELAEHYSVKPYVVTDPTTKPQKKCEQCHKSYRTLKMFLIEKKGM